MEENLKSQEGIKNVKILQLKGFAEIKLDIEQSKINKQQVLDIIKLSGDFKIEEVSENKLVEAMEIVKTTNIHQVPELNLISPVAGENPSKVFFIWGLLVGFSIVSLLINIVFGYLLFGSSAPKETVSAKDNQVVVNNPEPRAPSAPTPVQPTGPVQDFKITKNDNVRGNFNAPITLVEYSDFECPYCGRIYPTFKQLLNDYPNQVRLVYKYFPLSFHPNAQKAAEAAECASEQGKFWEYHDKLFDNQAGGFSIANFKQWADDLNLNTNKFNDCLNTGKYAQKVQADEADGQNRGVQGTPATFVNGQLISGAVPYESFKSVIDQLLTK